MSAPASESSNNDPVPVAESAEGVESAEGATSANHAEHRAQRRANFPGNALLILGVCVVLVINLWLVFNMIMVEVLGIPRAKSTAAVPYRDAVKGILPFPTPWWVGGLIVAGLAGLLSTSWKREYSSSKQYRDVRDLVHWTGVIAAVFTVGSINLAQFYTPGDPFSSWNFIAAAAGGVTVVAQLRQRQMRRRSGLAVTRLR